MSQFIMQQQCQTNWCWAAVTASVFQYFFPNEPITQGEIAGALIDPKCGCDPQASQVDCNVEEALTDAIKAGNTLCTPGIDATLILDTVDFDKIRSEIDAGFPVCARVEFVGEHLAHFVIITCYALFPDGEQWLSVADPETGSATLLPLTTFQTAYAGNGQWRQSFLLRMRN